MAPADHDEDNETPVPAAPAELLARDAFAMAARAERRAGRLADHLYGTRETGPGWIGRTEDTLRVLVKESEHSKFLMWKIITASTLGGAAVAIVFNVFHYLGH